MDLNGGPVNRSVQASQVCVQSEGNPVERVQRSEEHVGIVVELNTSGVLFVDTKALQF